MSAIDTTYHYDGSDEELSIVRAVFAVGLGKLDQAGRRRRGEEPRPPPIARGSRRRRFRVPMTLFLGLFDEYVTDYRGDSADPYGEHLLMVAILRNNVRMAKWALRNTAVSTRLDAEIRFFHKAVELQLAEVARFIYQAAED